MEKRCQVEARNHFFSVAGFAVSNPDFLQNTCYSRANRDSDGSERDIHRSSPNRRGDQVG
jgi:hypothetical protein